MVGVEFLLVCKRVDGEWRELLDKRCSGVVQNRNNRDAVDVASRVLLGRIDYKKMKCKCHGVSEVRRD